MNTLYDSDAYLVNHLLPAPEEETPADRPMLLRHGFEIVNKQTGREVYLDGAWAEFFQQRLLAWQHSTPSQEEVEDTLAQYAELAHTPIHVH